MVWEKGGILRNIKNTGRGNFSALASRWDSIYWWCLHDLVSSVLSVYNTDLIFFPSIPDNRATFCLHNVQAPPPHLKSDLFKIFKLNFSFAPLPGA